MAILKDLIVLGASRYIGDTYLSLIRSGIWQGTTIDVLHGGTGSSIAPTAWGIIYTKSTSEYACTAAGTSGYFLKANGNAAPSWAAINASTVGLGNVENTKLSTWTGSTNISKLGTITTGTWNGTRLTSSYIPTDVTYTGSTLTLTNKTISTGSTYLGNAIADTYIASASKWNAAYNALIASSGDVSGTIDRWDEVVAFLSTVTEGLNLASILQTYVTTNTTLNITGLKLFIGSTIETSGDTVRMPIKVILSDGQLSMTGHHVAAIGFSTEIELIKGFIGYERTGSWDKGRFVMGLNTTLNATKATFADIKFSFDNDGTLTATTFAGNATSATKLKDTRTISLSGAVTGSGNFDGTSNLNITTLVNHTHSAKEIVGDAIESITPFYVENVHTGNITVKIVLNNANAYVATLEISSDNINWELWGNTSTSGLTKVVPKGGRVYIRSAYDVGYLNTSDSTYNYLGANGSISIGGNIMSLGYKNFIGLHTITKSYAYSRLCHSLTVLYSASSLVLPATTLSERCYSYMFYYNRGLLYPPLLAATTLAPYCYLGMFSTCSSLQYMPDLPAKVLVEGCYLGMFGSSGLLTMKSLPATTLAKSCYLGMFANCKSLTSILIPAVTTLEYQCYHTMFDGCTRITSVPTFPATTLAEGCCSYMFRGCTSLTTAPAILPATTLKNTCYMSMFQNCTSLVNPPVLPAMSTATYCYREMFSGCTSLAQAPALPATTLGGTNAYLQMFQGCTSLITAPELPAVNLGTNCYQYTFNLCSNLCFVKVKANTWATSKTTNWLNGVASSGIFAKPSALQIGTGTNQIPSNNVSGIPPGWIVINDLEELTRLEINTSSLPTTIAGNKSSITALIKIYYLTTQNVETYIEQEVESNNFGENSTENSRLVTVTFNYVGLTITRQMTQEGNPAILPMYFQNISNSATTISIMKDTESVYTATLETSTDNINWTLWGSTSTTELTRTIPVNGRLYIRATSDVGYFSTAYNLSNVFSSTNNVNVGGNIMSLSYKNFIGKLTITRNAANANIFRGMSTLIDASNLVLPATSISIQCYYAMFKDCTNLTTIFSILPATTASTLCYWIMFEGCTSLLKAPELPATTLGGGCYTAMFRNCSSLLKAPELPATTVVNQCYLGMFQGCRSLIEAPELPATTVATECYQSMFQGCTSLTTAPALPATTLARNCYFRMFMECSSITTAPELPASTLVENCYFQMFYYSRNLNYIKILATNWNTDYVSNWVSGVSSTGTFVKPSATTIPTGTSGIPSGWTVQNI